MTTDRSPRPINSLYAEVTGLPLSFKCGLTTCCASFSSNAFASDSLKIGYIPGEHVNLDRDCTAHTTEKMVLVDPAFIGVFQTCSLRRQR